MYLKQLEMQGFKSFPEKIRLKFTRGITAVVGPNGSGKSNVADAVRWVLGEAGAKNLRGQKMEDVIFAGTQNRKPLGFAEVSLVIDNEDKKLNIDFAEVTVTRRLYRSGESAYLINGAVCRRKDILELFMDTGVGKEGYSIVGQGRIDEILSAKSEDRRALFEEAAGIVKFKNRRNEAAKKLENERANLLRVEDIISETEGRLEPLEKAAEKAKKYLKLSEELKETDISIFVLDVKKYEAQIEKLSEAAETLQTQIEETEKKLNEAEGKKSLKKENSERLNSDIEKLNEEITELKVGYNDKLGEIKLLTAEREHRLQQTAKMAENRKAALKSIEEKTKELEAVETRSRLSLTALEGINQKAETAEGEVKALQAEIAEKEALAEKVNKEILGVMKGSANKKEEIAKLSERMSGIKDRRAKLLEETEVSEGQLNQKEALLASLNKEKQDILSAVDTLEKSRQALLSESRDLSIKSESLEKKQKELTFGINNKKSEINILSGLESSYEGYYNGVKAVLKNRNGLKGICGAVGELISVNKEYELAIETALGGALQNVIVESEETAKEAINFLKKTKGGRATFMPLTAVKKSFSGLNNDVRSFKGFIGSADELVSCDEKYSGVIKGLLGRTAVVDTLENGIALAKKTGYSVKTVTLTGEIFNAGGSITGGASSRKQGSILSRKNDLDRLKAEKTSLEADLAKINDRLAGVNFNLSSVKRDIESNRTAYNGKAVRLESIKTRIESEEKLLKEGRERLERQNSELKGLTEEEQTGADLLGAAGKGLSESEEKLEGLNESLGVSREKAQKLRESLEEKIKSLTALRLESERTAAELLSLEKDTERLKGEIEGIKNDEELSTQESEKLAADIEKAEADKKRLEEEAHSLSLEADKKTETYNGLLKERYEINKAVSEIEEEIKDINDTLLNLNRQKTSGDERLSAVREKSHSLYDNMWESYEITYPEAVKLFKEGLSLNDLNKRAKELKGQIKSLGSVNTAAPEEYAETKERYEFLTSQRADILKAEQDLAQITDQLETIMKDKFSEGFKAINESFKKVFKEMFGGGTAYVALSDENDVLNSGIEINAQPPGKKLQSMLLLSGGERALTAMALLFAILRLKPSPFCILDEIEAALDEANVSRYAKYIKSLSDTSQFIVITHRKGTMVEADNLYGITMQEQGISKMVSVSLKEADALTD